MMSVRKKSGNVEELIRESIDLSLLHPLIYTLQRLFTSRDAEN